MSLEKFTPAFTFSDDRLAALKAIVPEAFNAEGRLDPEALRSALGEVIEDGKPENFGLSWPGKRDARRLALTPIHKALHPGPGEGVDEATTRNVFIEGDNLEALKLLRKAYAGRVKMIYIDPPYNTGNDFVYRDDFSESAEDYEARTGQRGDDGERLMANPKSSGRFHSNWLNMIYPRLMLARDLLRDDGVIFVSIDDNEVHNLRQVMSEVFGEENFIGQLIWKSRQNKDNRTVNGLSIDHEYIVLYGSHIIGDARKSEQYTNPDNDPRGPWASGNMVGLQPKNARPNLHYDLINPETKINYGCPPLGWRYDKRTMAILITEGRILWPSNSDGRPRRKVFFSELGTETTGYSSIVGTDIYTRNGSSEIDELFGGRIFDFPKPSELIRQLILQGSKAGDVVVDFFAGSGATAQAILQENINNSQESRKFILVQLPEETTNKKYPTIAEITKERIRRVSKKLKAEAKANAKASRQAALPLEAAPPAPDLGFKVFKAGDSHFKRWADYEGEDTSALQLRLDDASREPLRAGWQADAVLTEIALQEGFPLDSRIAPAAEFKRNTVHVIQHEWCAHRLFVCLDAHLQADTLRDLRLLPQDVFICFDSALTDESKLRLTDAVKVKVI
jgi:adenine-specific DNA-methyltransferase